MKQNNTADRITARNTAGHTTDLAIWHFIHDVSAQLAVIHSEGKVHGNVSLDSIAIEGKNFVLMDATGDGIISDDIWNLGACIYEFITGSMPFGGKGKDGQTEESPLPVFSESKASRVVSSLMTRCLSFNSGERITAKEVSDIAKTELQRQEQYAANIENLKYKKPQNIKVRMKTYDFWPEVMISLLSLIMMFMPQAAIAQNDAEMDRLIRLTITMRDQSKRAQVLKALKDDDKWTLMDELKRDANECSFKDKVDMFGINDIAAEIAQKEKGIVNVGGRFKHSADGKHHYSFIELTALSKSVITFNVKGHKGIQKIAVIPFDPKCRYEATFFSDGKEQHACTVKNEISFFSVAVGKRGNYEFEIKNNDTKNASFAVITYNPMK